MSILVDKPTVRQLSRKSCGVKLGQKSSVFPSLKSADELGRISPQRPLISLWAELLSRRTRSSPKLKGKGWTEPSRTKNKLLRGISEKVAKLYRHFMVHRND